MKKFTAAFVVVAIILLAVLFLNGTLSLDRLKTELTAKNVTMDGVVLEDFKEYYEGKPACDCMVHVGDHPAAQEEKLKEENWKYSKFSDSVALPFSSAYGEDEETEDELLTHLFAEPRLFDLVCQTLMKMEWSDGQKLVDDTHNTWASQFHNIFVEKGPDFFVEKAKIDGEKANVTTVEYRKYVAAFATWLQFTERDHTSAKSAGFFHRTSIAPLVYEWKENGEKYPALVLKALTQKDGTYLTQMIGFNYLDRRPELFATAKSSASAGTNDGNPVAKPDDGNPVAKPDDGNPVAKPDEPGPGPNPHHNDDDSGDDSGDGDGKKDPGQSSIPGDKTGGNDDPGHKATLEEDQFTGGTETAVDESSKEKETPPDSGDTSPEQVSNANGDNVSVQTNNGYVAPPQ